jgi:ribose transport system ATP-binding protein
MPLLELRGVSKSFPGVQALHRVDLDVESGEIHALIGENGAGKSTLIKLLSGVFPRDSGAIRFKGTEIAFTSPHEAQQAGIRTLYQEFNLLPQLSVEENIFLGSEPRFHWLPLIDWREMRRQARAVLDRLGVDIEPDARVCDLSVAEQQMVELAKIFHAQAQLLIMDEPTATLSKREVDLLFRLVRVVKSRGIAILYITHRLDEVKMIADRVTVLRDGRRIATVDVADTSADQLVRLMSGQRVNHAFSRSAARLGSEILRVEDLTRRPVFENISFTLRAGEIVGLAGLLGAGRSALVQAIFGFEPAESGSIFVDGVPATVRSPQDAVALGMGLLPEDRQQQAVLLEMTARENITLAALRRTGPLINPEDERELAEKYIQRLRIKTPGTEAKARTLSGGTQQKLILSRWLALHPRILIFDEPTRGIDVNAKAEIYRMFTELVGQGIAILIVSSELPEIVRVCDRVLVMRAGHITATLEGAQIIEEKLVRYVMGDAV